MARHVYERVEERDASILIDTGQASGLVGRHMRPWYFVEYPTQPLKFIHGSHRH